jgi:hypothetical protein
MAQFGEIYEAQDIINETTHTDYIALQNATAVLNTEQNDQDRDSEDQAQRNAMAGIIKDTTLSAMSSESIDATYARLSGHYDLSKLTPAQIDRLELGFQEAITADGRLHRMYIYLEDLYARVPK